MKNNTMEYPSELVLLNAKKHRKRYQLSVCIVSVLALLILCFANIETLIHWLRCPSEVGYITQQISKPEDWCPLPKVKVLQNDSLTPSSHFDTPEVLQKQIERLSAAVSIPTESFDDNGEVDEDPRWASFNSFHRLLEDLFPLVHSHFTLHKVNRYGLLFTLNGSDPTLKPLLLTAHQDVVPAGPNSSWTRPPFEPFYDGQFLWGRGSTDCKNVLIGVLSAVEDLLSQQFKPQRTIVLSFGFDEETGGRRGAKTLGQVLQTEWGSSHDSFEFLLDEGGMGLREMGDVLYAFPAVAEKGYHDIKLTLHTSGGHSSKPPRSTGIGIMSAMMVALENEPYIPRLIQTNPFRKVLECQAIYSPNETGSWLKEALQSDDEVEIASKLAEENFEERWLMQTSQAVTVFNGGVKVNALPEKVEVLINHRVAPHESIEFVNTHALEVLRPVAARHGVEIFHPQAAISPDILPANATATLTLQYPQSLDVAPISPTDNQVWALFAGTLRSTFQADETTPKRVVPVGNIMTGNTDTQHYWNLTRNIYRFTPAMEGSRLNTHGSDERMGMRAHVQGMKFYYDLIRNFDAWDGN